MPLPSDYLQLCGFVQDPEARAAFEASLTVQSYSSLPRASGAGKKMYLWEASRKVIGKDIWEIQTIGDCTSKAIQRAIANLWCVRIALGGLLERFPGMPASEGIYALARHEFGNDLIGKGDGAVVSFGIRGVMEVGVLLRQKYPTVDLTEYSGKLAREWGAPGHGMPDELEPIAKLIPVKDAAPIRDYSELRDALFNKELVVGGCNTIFADHRDADGFLTPGGRGSHATIFTGFDDTGKRPGAFYDNRSWPDDWVSGPRKDNAPEGGGFVSPKIVDKMMSEGEWYAVSDVEGFPDQSDLNLMI